ncbi:integral membrane regulator, partial [Streptomyces sp. NPDC052015]
NALLLGLAFYALAVLLVTLDRVRPNPLRRRAKNGFRLQPPVG